MAKNMNGKSRSHLRLRIKLRIVGLNTFKMLQRMQQGGMLRFFCFAKHIQSRPIRFNCFALLISICRNMNIAKFVVILAQIF